MVGKINEVHDKITQSKQNRGWIYNLPVIYIRVYYALLTGLTGLTVNDFCRSSLMKTCRGTHTKKNVYTYQCQSCTLFCRQAVAKFCKATQGTVEFVALKR